LLAERFGVDASDHSRRGLIFSPVPDPAALAWFELSFGRTNYGNSFALVPAVDPEIIIVNRDDAVAGIELAHANEAKVGQIGLAVGITAREGRKLGQMVLAVKS
jgi:hypothetical protein